MQRSLKRERCSPERRGLGSQMEASLAPALGPGEHRRTFLSSFRVAQVAFVPRTPGPQVYPKCTSPHCALTPQDFFCISLGPLYASTASRTVHEHEEREPCRNEICRAGPCARVVTGVRGRGPGGRAPAAGGPARASRRGVRYNYTVGKTAAFINIKQTTRALWRTVQHPYNLPY